MNPSFTNQIQDDRQQESFSSPGADAANLAINVVLNGVMSEPEVVLDASTYAIAQSSRASAVFGHGLLQFIMNCGKGLAVVFQVLGRIAEPLIKGLGAFLLVILKCLH